MTRSLNRAVLAGGVVYPAGTASTSDLEQSISNPDYWTGEADKPAEPKPARKRAPKKGATGGE